MAQAESNLPKLASPAQRALAGAGITQLVQLTSWRENARQGRVEQLHTNSIQLFLLKQSWICLLLILSIGEFACLRKHFSLVGGTWILTHI
jgi:hypothetical protein